LEQDLRSKDGASKPADQGDLLVTLFVPF
jgi:hypothetical protein